MNQKALAGLEGGDLAGAEELLLQALSGAPEEPVLHANLAEVYCRLGRYEDALRHQSRCVELQAGKSPAQNRRLAEILLRTQRSSDTVARLEKLYAGNPDDSELLVALCVAHLGQENDAQLRSLITEGRRKFPDSPSFQSLEARIALRDGNPDAARSLLEAIVQHHPDFPSARLLLGDLDFESGEFSSAAQHYEKALASDDQLETALKLGKTFARLEAALPAEKYLRQAIRGQFQSEALLELAALYLQNPGGEWSRNQSLSQAFQCCDRVLAADPYNLRARNLKAMIYARRRQLQPMLNELRKSLTLNPNQPAVREIVEAYESAGEP